MKLNPAQAEAVNHLDGPLLVIAGPGTGKTQLLSSRVVNILNKTDTNPENILCLTFTESGATNMRIRLASLIGRAAANVHIHTYHAFGRTILDAYQHYSEQPLRLYDTPIDNVTAHQVLASIQSSLPLSDILRTAKISDLSSTIKELKSSRLTASDIRVIAETNLEQSTKLNPAISPLLQSLVPRKYQPNVETYNNILAELTKFISEKPITKNVEPEANYLARSLKQILDEAASSEKPSIAPFTKWRNDHFEKDGAGNYRSKNFIANKKLLSLAGVMEQYQATLTEQNLFDYADMIEQAIAYLSKDRGFRLTLQEKYQFILLDEFQDTNPSQFDLVRLLTDYEKPNVMAVGDDDQAIMEFQGAEASNLLDFENHYHAKVITLTENYRSTQQILDFARKIADQITDSFSKAHGINKSLVASNPKLTVRRETGDPEQAVLGGGRRGAPTKKLPLGSLQFFVGEETDRTQNTCDDEPVFTPHGEISRHQFPAAPSEYAWTAQKISELIAEGIDPSKIVILTPKHKYINSLLPHLSQHSVPISYEKRENILENPAISSLITLARFVQALATERQSSHLLLELLSAPHWGIPPLTAINAINSARADKQNALTYLQESNDENLSSLANFFASLATHSFDTPLELMLDYMLGATPLDGFRSPFLEYYTSHDISAFSLYENLSILKEAVSAHSHKDTLRLSDLSSTIDAYQSAHEPITNTSPYQTAESAVQILSVHKAKGLEFSHVFLVAVDDAAWGNATGNNNTFTLPKNLAYVRHTGITEDERLRVFFVAITRAETHLYLTSSEQDFAGKTSAPLEYLGEHDGISPLLPEPTQKIIIHKEEARDLTALKSHWSTSYHSTIPDLTLILKNRLQNYRLTPTDLTTFIDIVYAGPLTFYTQKLLGAPREPADTKVIYGNLLHDTLDFATKNKSATSEDILAHFVSLAEATDLTPEDKSGVLEQGTTNLPHIIEKLYKVLQSPTSVSEVNFRPERITVDGIPITGKIDLLNIDEQTKQITIIDYKTSPYDPKKSWTNNPTLFKYRLQLGFYKLLLANSPKYSKYEVTSAYLEHLNPTPHGELISRPYTFPPADEAELKKLITTVYDHIINLDFPPIPPDADRTLRDIKSFISELITPA